MVLLVDVICDSYKDHFWPEIRLDDEITVGELKDKLYIKTGIDPYSMVLLAFDPGNPENKLQLDDDNRNLSTYSVCTGYTIEVKESKNTPIVDINSNNGCVLKKNLNVDYSPMPNSNSKLYQHYVDQIDRFGEEIDESTFQRYEMSDEDYDKRENGLRGFINRMRSKAESKNRLSNQQSESKPKLNDLS